MDKTEGNLERVLTVADPLIAGHLESILSERGIHCHVRNRHLVGGAGEIPPLEAWPEIWVDAEDAAAARRLIDEVLEPTGAAAESWVCRGCGETIEGQFAQCWRCGEYPD
ncbi:putative signal transducing protein [Spiribacter pallidus]|uniref:DUF2007 domain-containing protein n=1 Tax=Spiribacter pallidus TaxID=1987936 RepID=A0ABV3TDV4_9GAMM